MMDAMQDAVSRRGPLDTTVEVETPEHVRFRYQIAGPARRAVAYLIDLTVRGAFMVALGMLFLFTTGWNRLGGFEVGALLVVYFAAEWGYYVLSELLMNGASLGKRALRMRVSAPSSASGCSRASSSLTHRPRTASPRNSSRWLSGTLNSLA